jgi:hypothetical protein
VRWRALSAGVGRGAARAESHAAIESRAMKTIRAAELFRAGRWCESYQYDAPTARTYTAHDLDVMIEAAPAIGFAPPIMLEHFRSDEPAHGWVERLRRVDDVLCGDLILTDRIYGAIASRIFDTVSLEISRNHRLYSLVCTALALVPYPERGAVTLAPLSYTLTRQGDRR